MDSSIRDQDPVEPFMAAFRRWVEAYSIEKKRRPPDQDWFDAVKSRIPPGLMESIVTGLNDGTIGEMGGHEFVPEGAYKPKHYSWFAGFGPKGPNVWWEAFIHAAEFSRIRSLASKHPRLRVGFEDHLMDITLYRDQILFACYEVKRARRDADLLISEVRKWGEKGITRDMPDRRDDPLRKAKYLAFPQGGHKPKYFSVVAIGVRREFSVSYELSGPRLSFKLLDDVIPIG